MSQIKVCKNCGSLENAAAQRCSKCNTYIGDYGNDVPVQSAPPVNAAPTPPRPAAAPRPAQPVMSPVMAPAKDPRDEVLSVGRYLLLFFLGCIPVVNIICWIIWLVDKSTNRNIKNFVKAQLVIVLISVLISVISVLIFGAGLSMLF